MYGHVYQMSVDQTSCRILVWGGVDIIHRKTGLLAHKVTITKRGNFPISHHWIIFVWVRVPAASPSFGLMTHWTCCTSSYMGVIKKQIIFFITLDSTQENIFLISHTITHMLTLTCSVFFVCVCVSVVTFQALLMSSITYSFLRIFSKSCCQHIFLYVFVPSFRGTRCTCSKHANGKLVESCMILLGSWIRPSH